MSNSLYEMLKAKGHDLSWYEKSARTNPGAQAPIKLTDEYCGRLSVYFLDKLGKLFTTDAAGNAYMQVRDTGKKITRDIYICLGCSKQFKTFKEASGHYANEVSQSTDRQDPS